MGSNARLYHSGKRIYQNKKTGKEIVAGEIYWFNLHGDQIYDARLKLGVTPNKSLTVNFPEMPQQFVRHFIRGCWDGDGTIYFEKKSGQKRAGYVTGSEKFIKGLVAELTKADIPKIKIFEARRKNISYYLKFYGDQIVKLYHFLYDNVPSSQYLERKYNIFKRYEVSGEDLRPATQGTLPLRFMK